MVFELSTLQANEQHQADCLPDVMIKVLWDTLLAEQLRVLLIA